MFQSAGTAYCGHSSVLVFFMHLFLLNRVKEDPFLSHCFIACQVSKCVWHPGPSKAYMPAKKKVGDLASPVLHRPGRPGVAVEPSEPRTKCGLYWGFQTRHGEMHVGVQNFWPHRSSRIAKFAGFAEWCRC